MPRRGQQPFKFRQRHRLAQQVALVVRAARIAQQITLLCRLDAGGHHRQAERAADADDGLDGRRVVRVAAQPAQQGLGDLDLVERKPLEVGQRRQAHAEFVHREVDPAGHLHARPLRS